MPKNGFRGRREKGEIWNRVGLLEILSITLSKNFDSSRSNFNTKIKFKTGVRKTLLNQKIKVA